jgi:hypothetical protein
LSVVANLRDLVGDGVSGVLDGFHFLFELLLSVLICFVDWIETTTSLFIVFDSFDCITIISYYC